MIDSKNNKVLTMFKNMAADLMGTRYIGGRLLKRL
jgi:hypothetical protein